MPGTHVFSVHGNAFVSEQLAFNATVRGYGADDTVADVGDARGWGRTFRRSGWYHVALPSLTQVDGSPRYLEEFFIEHIRTPRMRFDEVHVWDGPRLLWTGPPVDAVRLRFRPRAPDGVRRLPLPQASAFPFASRTKGTSETTTSRSRRRL